MAALKLSNRVIAVCNENTLNELCRMYRVNNPFFDEFLQEHFSETALGATIPRVCGTDHTLHVLNAKNIIIDRCYEWFKLSFLFRGEFCHIIVRWIRNRRCRGSNQLIQTPHWRR